MSGVKKELHSSSNDEEIASSSREPLDHIENIDIFSQTSLKSILEATKSSNSLPTGDDYDFYSTFSSVRDVLDIESQRVLSLVDGILNQQNVKGKLSRAGDIEDKFDILTEANDHILERIGTNLDEASGIKRTDTNLVISSISSKRGQIATSWNKKKGSQESPSSFRLLAAKNTPRPQFKFKDKIDNSENPFIPKITSKPNAKMSLEESLKVQDSAMEEFVSYSHPYQCELDLFQPSDSQLQMKEPQSSNSMSDTPFTLIDTVKGLETLLKKLKHVNEIAIDLEAHSYRTYQGITCLMQISTRSEDFIVDTISLRSELNVLNTVFTDPTILKVFHGGDMDILWLQRDFGLFIVNMFDTGQAARVLNFERLSLAHLLNVYCQVEAQKQYQLADWRIRPLPNELIEYARTDTHYLLYIYDKLRNELLEHGNDQKNLLCSVYDRSKQICLKTYKKLILNEDTHLELYRKSRKVFDSQQLSSLKHLYLWRDKIARQEDESTGYVLPNHMLLQISSILPREKQGILACCNPIPPIVRQYINEIYAIIQDARSEPILKKEKKAVTAISSKTPTYGINNTSIFSPHDLSKSNSLTFSSIFDPNLVAASGSMFQPSASFLVSTKPIISAFSKSAETSTLSSPAKKAAEIKEKLTQPFDKFLPGLETKCKNTWLLKPSTNTIQKESTSSPSYNPPAKRKKPTDTKEPLINQIREQKRQKIADKTEPNKTADTPIAPIKQKKKDKANLTNNFKPFDYKAADKSIFESKFANSKFDKKKKFKKR